MSDPVTNVEIEDVLSSIRRLVSDGDKARTRESNPVELSVTQVEIDPVEADKAAESPTDRFVLTPALMVVDDRSSEDSALVEVEDGTDDGWFREDDDTNAHDHAGDDQVDDADQDVSELQDHAENRASLAEDTAKEGPLELTNMVWEPIDGDGDGDAEVAAEAETVATEATNVETPDRSDLVATIAELEAAVGGDADDYEPDGSEAMGQTIAWPGAVARNLEDNNEAVAEPIQYAPDETNMAEQDPVVDHRSDAPQVSEDVYEDDDLDDLLEAGGVALDEEALRALVSEVVREELTGPLGERITRNVRKLVRREIYRILSSQDFD